MYPPPALEAVVNRPAASRVFIVPSIDSAKCCMARVNRFHVTRPLQNGDALAK